VTDSEEDAALEQRYRDATAALDAVRTDAFEKFLKPFAETFAQLHEVTLGDLPTSEAVPELAQVDTEAHEAAAAAVEDLVDGGAGRALHAALLLSIQTLSTHPTLVSTMVRAVPGGSAGNLAALWAKGVGRSRAARPQITSFLRQTNRNLARNKKTLIIGGLSAAALASLTWAWRADRADYEARVEEERRQKLLEVANRRTELLEALDLDRLLFASERAEEATYTLTNLIDLGLNRLHALRAIVDTSTEYDAYAQPDRLLVAELAGLAQTTAAVIAASVVVPQPDGPGEGDSQALTLDAARHVLSRYARDQNPGTAAAPVISWVTGVINTTQQRNQLAYLLEQPAYLQRLAKRCGNSHQRVQEGFHFEWLHEMGFNLDALGNDSTLRAYVTEWLGRPADAADIVIQTPDGKVIREVQAKVVESPYKRAGLKNGVTDSKYDGKDLLVPTEHTPAADKKFDSVLNRPEGNIFKDRYDDARTRLTDRISVDSIASDPITTGKLAQASTDPHGHLQQLAHDFELRRMVRAAVTSGGTAMVTSIATDLTTHLVTQGTLDGFNWAHAGVAGARTSAATTVAVAAGSYVQATGEKAVAGGSTNLIHDSWANGDHGPAITQAAIDIAAIAHGLATGRLTPAEAAEATGEAVIQSAIIWVCTAIARNTIPDAEVAALVGGFVGQYGGKLVTYGIRVAILGRNLDPKWDDAYDALLADTASLELACAVERDELAVLGRQHHIAFTDHVLPALESLTASSGADRHTDPDADLIALASIANQFAGAPLFDTLEAFDAFMADPNSTLVLHLSRE